MVSLKIKLTSKAELSTIYNDFGLRLFAQLAQLDAPQNIFLSPFSIAVALVMTYNGAVHETQRAMGAALGLDHLSLAELNRASADLLASLENPDPQVQWAVANSLWIKLGIAFQPDFSERNRSFYKAEVRSIDFTASEAASTINTWIKSRTRDKIDRVIRPADLNALTSLILINAIYFKGLWSDPFDPALTHDQPFYLLDGTTQPRPLMYQTGEFLYTEDKTLQAVSLPYGAGRVSLIVLLPRPDLSFADFQAQLTERNWRQWLSRLQSRKGHVFLPRFKLQYGQELGPSLSALGMGVAFSNAADFSGMCVEPLCISQVIHQAVVDVNEEGTEAAAVTAVMMQRASMPPKNRFTVRADRPFCFAIVDQPTQAILFFGSVVNPS
jgi:serpin B